MGSRAGLCKELFSGKVCRREQVTSQPKASCWQYFGTFSGPGWGPVHRGPQPTPERPRCTPQACCKVTVPGPLPVQPCRAVGLTAGSRLETVLCCRACGREQGQCGGLRVWAGDHPSLESGLSETHTGTQPSGEVASKTRVPGSPGLLLTPRVLVLSSLKWSI